MNPDVRTLRSLKWTVCLAMLAGFAITRPLWLTSRPYPLTPVFDWLPSAGAPVDLALYGTALGLLIAIMLLRKPLPAMAIFLVLLGYFALGDQSRWHPWVYWDGFMMLALAFAHSKAADSERVAGSLDACRVLLVGSYVWAGIQKVGVTFYYNLFPWMLSTFVASPSTSPIWSKVAFAVPVVEILIGVLLLTVKYRTVGVVMAVGMHLTILMLLGPFGHNVNANVWPWNLGLCVVVVLLFHRSERAALSILRPRSPLHALAVVLFLVMPVFTLADLWDAYPGFSLYSGSQRGAYIQLDAVAKTSLGPEFAPYIDEQDRLLPSRWAMGVLAVPEYAEPRIYRALLNDVCRRVPQAKEGIKLVVVGKPERLTGKRRVEEELGCH